MTGRRVLCLGSDQFGIRGLQDIAADSPTFP